MSKPRQRKTVPIDPAEAAISRARLHYPQIDALLTAAENIASLRSEWDPRIANGVADRTGYLVIAAEMTLARSRCEAALRNVSL